MVRQLKHKFILIATLVALSISCLQAAPVAAASLPVQYMADAGSCTLPDGSQGAYETSNTHVCCPFKDAQNNTSCLYDKYLNPLIALLSGMVGLLVVGNIIYGAIEYVTSGGDPQRASAGRKRITNALIGLAAYFALAAFVEFLIPGGFLHG